MYFYFVSVKRLFGFAVNTLPTNFFFCETNEADKIDDFRREGLRQHHARSDWQAIVKPCLYNMAWEKVKHGWEKAKRTNPSSSAIIFPDIRPAKEYITIFIQSRKSSDNRTKFVPRDTWRVHPRGSSSIAATVFDQNNKTYEALFLIMEPNIY